MSTPRPSTNLYTHTGSRTEAADIAQQLDEPLPRVLTEVSFTKEQRDPYSANVNNLQPEQSSRFTSARELSSPDRRSIITPSHPWKTLFTQEIALDMMLEAQLMLMTVSTGILDATTFSTYNVFATKQTGNTLFLALYAFGHPALRPKVERNVAVSMAAFVSGVAAFGHLARCMRQRRRAWLLTSNLLQTAFLFAATAIRYWAPRTTSGPAALGVVALLAFASGGQVVGAVSVGLPELNTTMITGTLVQLSNDPKLFHVKNAPRNRRLIFYASLLSGCFIGVAAVRYRDATLGLLLAAVIKAVASVSFLFNRGIMVCAEVVDQEKNDGLPASGAATPISKILWGD
ncbi:hypothetical protein LTR36_009247 [Oleoguttula mirabilis]|uniref:DUF1275 domain protein n=1 Tax=Oleoguttula mirabilis TaxID=1507867 RepID=A0AAV9J6I4_9PEZI|nr:hypothetical protein LTR36_009247 [Oleoguttula mirabilis]